jgi:hypothetical protein
VTNVENTFYIIGTVAGPHPYPTMVRDFQSVIGSECLQQMPEMTGRQPDAVIACVGGGSNAMGIFYPYIRHEGVRLIGVEAAGKGLASGKHAASISAGSPGVLHGLSALFMACEAVSIAVGILGLKRSGQKISPLWVPTLALYFPLQAFAAYKALWEMLHAPFYWDKTTHGSLH